MSMVDMLPDKMVDTLDEEIWVVKAESFSGHKLKSYHMRFADAVVLASKIAREGFWAGSDPVETRSGVLPNMYDALTFGETVLAMPTVVKIARDV